MLAPPKRHRQPSGKLDALTQIPSEGTASPSISSSNLFRRTRSEANPCDPPIFPVSSLYRRARALTMANLVEQDEGTQLKPRHSAKGSQDTDGKIVGRKHVLAPVAVRSMSKGLEEKLNRRLLNYSTAHPMQDARRKRLITARTRSRSASPNLDAPGSGATSCPNSLVPFLARGTRSR